MTIDEKLDRIIELLEKLTDRPSVTHVHNEAPHYPYIPTPKRCTCHTNISGMHRFGCPLYKRPTVRG